MSIHPALLVKPVVGVENWQIVEEESQVLLYVAMADRTRQAVRDLHRTVNVSRA